MNRTAFLVALCIFVVACEKNAISNLQSSAPSGGVDAVTIVMDKDGNITLVIPGMSTPRVFHGAEFLNILASTPSITPQTHITLSPDRDVPDGITSLVKESLYMKGQKPIEVVFSDRGDEIVLVVVTKSSECETTTRRNTNKTKMDCIEVMPSLKRQFTDRARTNVSILPLDGTTVEYAAELGKEVIAAGFKCGGAGRAGFITEPGSGNR